MQLTPQRMLRYLKKQKQINNYLLKLKATEREDILALCRIQVKLLEVESEFRAISQRETK